MQASLDRRKANLRQVVVNVIILPISARLYTLTKTESQRFVDRYLAESQTERHPQLP
jgi:hypothetical protein